ncbi:MAG: hypothetical protein C4K60_14405 [Ideonella sp. MAG2]|nr:MAG: hypothetical protein C4K60_14405 [Ideonella sp. MAG2]
MAKIIWKENHIVRLRLRDDLFTIGQLLGSAFMRVHKLSGSVDEWEDIDLNQTEELFTVPVTNDVFRGLATGKVKHWDAAGELAQRIDPVQGEQLYGYDAAGRILRSRNLSAGQPLSAGLDFSEVLPQSQQPAPHLARVSGQDWREDFAWDAASNPAAASAQGSEGHVRHNRLLMWQDQRYAYDTLGRLTEKRVGRHTEQHLRWNAEHQLESVQTQRNGSSQTVSFEYDALGRRISKTNSFGSVFFIWDGLRLLQERHRNRVTTLAYEPDGYVPMARVDMAEPGTGAGADDAATPNKPRLYWFHTNASGAPEEITDEEGRVHWRARYKTWGNLALQEQPEVDSDRFAQPALEEQNLRLQGQYFDAETGLCYNTFRYYDPDCGRFISQDPIGLAGGLNLYQFGPNAIGWIDPWGWIGAPAGLPNTAGVYTIINGNDVYVGSAGGGSVGMNGRVSDISHTKAQKLLAKPGTTIQFQEVDLGLASSRAEKEHILRHFEQEEIDRVKRNRMNVLNSRRAEATAKRSRNLGEVKKHGAALKGTRGTC